MKLIELFHLICHMPLKQENYWKSKFEKVSSNYVIKTLHSVSVGEYRFCTVPRGLETTEAEGRSGFEFPRDCTKSVFTSQTECNLYYVLQKFFRKKKLKKTWYVGGEPGGSLLDIFYKHRKLAIIATLYFNICNFLHCLNWMVLVNAQNPFWRMGLKLFFKILNGMGKTKLATLTFVYCGEIVKSPIGSATANEFIYLNHISGLTRIHSSRMRTARLLTVSQHVLRRRVFHDPLGSLSQHALGRRGVSARRGLPHPLGTPPLWTEWLTGL